MIHHEGDNIGSLLKAEVALVTDITGFNPIVFANGKDWTDVPFKEGSGSLSCKKPISDNGTIYSYAARMVMPHWNDEDENELDKFLGQVSIWRFTDMNGKIRIIGAPGMAATVETEASTGESVVSENAVEIRVKIDQMFKAVKL